VQKVIGDLYAGERTWQSFAGERVGADDLELRDAARWLQLERRGYRGRVPPERANEMSVGEQPGNQARADEAACARDEDPHLNRS
jgi:hypothetical protein